MLDLPQNFWWVYPVVAIELILKGFALWRSARNEHKYWFIALLIINSAGVVPLVYLIFFSKWDIIEKQKSKLFSKRKKQN